MKSAIMPGQHFTWSAADGGSAGEAVVKDVKTDREEGLSPEAEGYVSLWIEASGLSGSRKDEDFAILLGTDGGSYLDGQAITVTVFD